jgi:putative transposase
MPWNETCTMNEKMKFIVAWQSHKYTLSELCRNFGISRKTGYKIICRFVNEGISGLNPISRAHHVHPHQTESQTIKLLLELKHRYPNWGPRKLKDWLTIEHPSEVWPASSTIGEILKRHGLVKPRKKCRKTPPHSEPFIACTTSNRVWSADFKGQFRVGTGELCYPLTITDNYSRYLLCCQGLKEPKGEPVKRYFEAVFREYGLPDAIKTDNGPPVASTALGGLSKLSVWWLQLGILPERIEPGCPEQNGRHERMHRTLKQYTAKPPKKSLRAQQRAFNHFKNEYNHERPHEGINRKRPSDVYRASFKEYPNKLPEIEYGDDVETRVVRSNGEIKLKGKKIFISETLRGQPIGLKEVDEGVWDLLFSKVKLGKLNLRLGKVIRPA